MRLWAGSSGFSYKEWEGPFYPKGLPDREKLAYYATHLNAVEINNTFYRMPKPELFDKWAAQVPESFRFAIKAPQRITHKQRLLEVGDSLEFLFRACDHLGPRLGPVLFQLPPYFKKNTERLDEFARSLPKGVQVVLEFRNASWFCGDVYDRLRDAGLALCIADFDDPARRVPFERTADFGYLRLRSSDYTDEALAVWASEVGSQGWKEAFVFFKHEDEGTAPALATRFSAIHQKRGA